MAMITAAFPAGASAVRPRRLKARLAAVALIPVAVGLFAAGLALSALAVPPALATCLPVAEGPGTPILRAAFAGGGPRSLPGTFPGTQSGTLARPVPLRPVPLRRAAAGRGPALPAGTVELTFLGHASFLIRTPANVTAITDFNGYIGAGFPPDIVTMNHAHETHYTDLVDPAIRHVLRGWAGAGGFPRHDLTVRDMRVRNVPTNIRDGAGGTEFAGNSIFVFETTDLCIAHLGHLHHRLTPEHAGRIGDVDVALVPIDDGYTMTQADMARVIDALTPRVVVPMHYFGPSMVKRFATLMARHGYATKYVDSPSVLLSKRTLPRRTVLVLASQYY